MNLTNNLTTQLGLVSALTKKFYNTMLKFCFPERDPENIEGDGIEDTDSIAGSTSLSKKTKNSERTVKKNKDSNFYVPIEQKDDVEKMKVDTFSLHIYMMAFVHKAGIKGIVATQNLLFQSLTTLQL